MQLTGDIINKNDITKLIEWLSQENIPRLTKGELTVEFEQKWAKKIGTEYSVYVNSGSSAILLTLAALQYYGDGLKNKKIVVPNLSWLTDVSTPYLLGYDVKLVDCNLYDLSVDLDELEKLFIAESPSVFLLVSILGFVPDMDAIMNLCDKYGVILLEDVCESTGSSYSGKNLGTFGLASQFSLYFGHHLSTIEGGFVNTDDEDYYNLLLSIRSHGWDRDCTQKAKNNWRSEWDVDDFSSLFTFYLPGLNLRSTDLQAFLGLGQLEKFDFVCEKRNSNYLLYNKYIKNNLLNLSQKDSDFISNYAYPILSENINDIIDELIINDIEVRPIMSGSMNNSPFVKKYIPIEAQKDHGNCNLVKKYGFYIPNHDDINEDQIINLCNIINNVG